MRGYHVYHDVWTNIEVNQDVILQKQPNNEFDQHAIGGFVKDLIPEQMLTKIGHLPRELAGALRVLTTEELDGVAYVVTSTKATRAPGLKGLHIGVKVRVTLDARRSRMVKDDFRSFLMISVILFNTYIDVLFVYL